MNTIAERLSWAIERQPREGRRRGLRLFQQRMEERARERTEAGEPELVGCALSTVQGYVSGEVVPSVDFLTEAAAILNVRPAWLTHGDGAPTIAEQRAALESGHSVPTDLERTFRRRIPDWVYLGPLARVAVTHTWSVLVGDRDPQEVIQEIIAVAGDVVRTVLLGDEVAARLGKAIGGPLAAVELHRGVIPPEHDEYVALVCAAVRLYARGQRRWSEESYFGNLVMEENDGDA
jgi:transcriptional regulator with XRE-family HTH domain